MTAPRTALPPEPPMRERPKRIRLQRTKGWRKPAGAIVVARPTIWGNPYSAMDVGGQYPSLDEQQLAGMLVACFRDVLGAGRIELPNWRYADGHRGRVVFTYPDTERIRAELAGHDLACWCSLDQPCHADVLLEIANAAAQPTPEPQPEDVTP